MHLFDAVDVSLSHRNSQTEFSIYFVAYLCGCLAILHRTASIYFFSLTHTHAHTYSTAHYVYFTYFTGKPDSEKMAPYEVLQPAARIPTFWDEDEDRFKQQDAP